MLRNTPSIVGQPAAAFQKCSRAAEQSQPPHLGALGHLVHPVVHERHAHLHQSAGHLNAEADGRGRRRVTRCKPL